MHIQKHTHTSTHLQSAHICNKHTKEVATTWHKSLVERGEKKLLFETKALHTHKKGEKRKRKRKCQTTPIFTNLKKRIRIHTAFDKATRLFFTK